MIDVKVTKMFFDRQEVIRALKKSTRAALSKVGAFIRQRAKTSMRWRKGPSKTGTPPHAHRGKGQLRKFLFFGYDPGAESVVVGPTPWAKAEAPRLNEFGGTIRRTVRVSTGRKAYSKAQAAAYRRKLLNRSITRAPTQYKTYQAKYPKRAFMGPALKAEIAAGTIPSQWRNSIKSHG